MKDLKENNPLSEVYDVTLFRELGHELIDVLADHLQQVQNKETFVLKYNDPEKELLFWQKEFSSTTNGIDLFKKIIDHSIAVHHPGYMGHQVAVPSMVAALSGLVAELLSNGTGVYEMGMASNAIEKIVTDFTATYIGYDKNASGILTSGGTLANLTALLAARKAKAPNQVWEYGHKEKLAVMVSEEAHYCIDRAARIMGLGSDGIIKVPVDEAFKIRTDLLEVYIEKAKAKGLRVIAIVGCASSTATGSYDNLNEMADFAKLHDLWFHVDGAHGGSVVFSNKYKHLVEGIAKANSVVIDFHKMLMTPSLNTALIFKHGEDAYKTFEQRAQYLWDSQSSEEWYNSGKKTFECTKLMMSIKAYAIIKMHGKNIFGKNIDYLYDLGKVFARMIKEDDNFELAIDPQSNIVNFRFIKGTENPERRNELNFKIRQKLIEKGKFYIVQTMIGEKRYLRTVLMNPLTTKNDCQELLKEIKDIAIQ